MSVTPHVMCSSWNTFKENKRKMQLKGYYKMWEIKKNMTCLCIMQIVIILYLDY